MSSACCKQRKEPEWFRKLVKMVYSKEALIVSLILMVLSMVKATEIFQTDRGWGLALFLWPVLMVAAMLLLKMLSPRDKSNEDSLKRNLGLVLIAAASVTLIALVFKAIDFAAPYGDYTFITALALFEIGIYCR